MSSTGVCACGGDRKPIGKCVRCGCPVCERCVGFIGGKAVCKLCATGQDPTIMMDTQSRGRRMDIEMSDSIVPKDDLMLRRKQQIRKVIQTLRKCSETAVLIMVSVGVILFIVFFSHILDFFSFYAMRVENVKNPLAKLTIKVAARTDMVYMRYSPAIGLYTMYMDKYPDAKDVPIFWYRVGMCYYYSRELRSARYYLNQFISRWPNHELKKDAFERVNTINVMLTAMESEDKPPPPDSKKPAKAPQ